MPISISHSAEPVYAIDIVDIYVNGTAHHDIDDNYAAIRTLIQEMDFYPILNRANARVYLRDSYDVGLDAFVFTVSTDLRNAEFTHYLLSRVGYPQCWLR
jgi:hypothetical protein